MLLYATSGGQWIYPARVTYSIVADGTNIGGTPSNLRQKLGVYANWEQQIQKAAAVWEAVAGVNLVQVADDGSAIGSGGYQQGDPSSGDIRIGGMAQPGNQLAFAYAPQPFNGGPVAGDIFFNTEQWWQTNASTYDVMTVAVHEFGHALGMGHSEIETAVMYAGYTSDKQSSTYDDNEGVRKIYGSRQSDRFDAAASNNWANKPTDLTPHFDAYGRISVAGLDITSPTDADWYKVVAPASGSMTIRMQSSRLSSLTPKFIVYNGGYQEIVTVPGAGYGDTITVTIPGVQRDQILYIKAMAGPAPANIGAYGLQVNVGSAPQAAFAPPYTAVASQRDQNPSTSMMGTGWKTESGFIPYLGLLKLDGLELLDGLAGLLGGVDGLYQITYGTLSGYGNAEIVDPAAPPVQAPGEGEAHRAGTRGPRSRGVVFGVPGGPSAFTAADDRGSPGFLSLQRSGRRVQARAARFQAVEAARSRVHHRRLVHVESAATSLSHQRIGAASRGDLTIPHTLPTSPS